MLADRVVGEILVARGVLAPEKLEELLQQCDERSEEFTDALLRSRLVSEELMLRTVGEHYCR